MMNTFFIPVDHHQKCIAPNYMRTKKIGSFCGSFAAYLFSSSTF